MAGTAAFQSSVDPAAAIRARYELLYDTLLQNAPDLE